MTVGQLVMVVIITLILTKISFICADIVYEILYKPRQDKE